MSRRTAADSPEVESTADGWRLELPSWTRPGLHPTTIVLAAVPVVFLTLLTTTVIAIRSSGSRLAHAIPAVRLMVAWALTMFSAAAMFGMNARLLRVLVNRLANRFGRREVKLAGRTLSLRRRWITWRTLDQRELQGAATVQFSAEGELLIAFDGQMPMRIAPGPTTDGARSLQRILEKALKSSKRRIASPKYAVPESAPVPPLKPTPGAYAIVAFGLLFTTVCGAFAVYQDVMLARIHSVPAKMLSSSITTTSRGGPQLYVRFVYDVDGVEYQSDRFWPIGPPTGSEVSAEIAAHLSGTKVLAMYPAGLPSHAYLVRRREPGTEVLILAGGFFLLLGMFKVARWPRTQLVAVAMWTVLGGFAIGDSAFGPMGSISTEVIVTTIIWLLVAAMAFRFAKANEHRPAQGGREDVSGNAPPPPLATPRRAIAKPLDTPAPRGSRAVASEIAAGGVRITIRRNSPVAIACGILLALSLIALLSMVTGHTAWIRSINPKAQSGDLIGFIATAVTAAVLLSFVLFRALTTRIFEADQAALSRTSEGPLGRHSNRWTRDDIAGIDAITRTYSGGRGGSRTVHTLELRRKAGKTVKLVGNLKKAELEWMGDLLSAALRIAGP